MKKLIILESFNRNTTWYISDAGVEKMPYMMGEHLVENSGKSKLVSKVSMEPVYSQMLF